MSITKSVVMKYSTQRWLSASYGDTECHPAHRLTQQSACVPEEKSVESLCCCDISKASFSCNKRSGLHPPCSSHLDFNASSHSTADSEFLGIAGNIDCILLRKSFIWKMKKKISHQMLKDGIKSQSNERRTPLLTDWYIVAVDTGRRKTNKR